MKYLFVVEDIQLKFDKLSLQDKTFDSIEELRKAREGDHESESEHFDIKYAFFVD